MERIYKMKPEPKFKMGDILEVVEEYGGGLKPTKDFVVHQIISNRGSKDEKKQYIYWKDGNSLGAYEGALRLLLIDNLKKEF